MQGFFGSAPLAIGSDAPDFSLPDQAGNAVSLASFRGRNNVALIFYPADMTPG
jgi:peroxiredoxin Q/BCP